MGPIRMLPCNTIKIKINLIYLSSFLLWGMTLTAEGGDDVPDCFLLLPLLLLVVYLGVFACGIEL